MSTHTITAEIEARFTFPGLVDGEHETAYPTLEVEYSFVQGWAGSGPSFFCPGEPPEPDEVDLINARLIKGDGLEPTDERVHEWAREWLHGDGYHEACAHAKRGPDPDLLYDRRRDDADFHFQPIEGDDF